MSITINGQLLLCMLAEQLVDEINDCTMLQINTDGMTVRIREDAFAHLMEICKQWEERTQLELEYVNYDQMIIRDVNNYIGVYGNGKFKHKGVFEVDRQWHKNHSKRVVSIAIHNYFIEGIPVEQTIRQHVQGLDFNDKFTNHGIFDYCLAKKATGSFVYEARRVNSLGAVIRSKIDSKILRYFVSNKGDVVLKLDSMKSNSKGQLVEAHPQKGRSYYLTQYNIHEDSDIYDIDYSYYIRECNKLINTIEHSQQSSLF